MSRLAQTLQHIFAFSSPVIILHLLISILISTVPLVVAAPSPTSSDGSSSLERAVSLTKATLPSPANLDAAVPTLPFEANFDFPLPIQLAGIGGAYAVSLLFVVILLLLLRRRRIALQKALYLGLTERKSLDTPRSLLGSPFSWFTKTSRDNTPYIQHFPSAPPPGFPLIHLPYSNLP